MRDPGEERRREALRIGSDGSRNSADLVAGAGGSWSGTARTDAAGAAGGLCARPHDGKSVARRGADGARRDPVNQRRERLVACLQAVRVDDDRAASGPRPLRSARVAH